MILEQKQALSQKLVLTQVMRQSLQCLQFSALELNEFAQELALSNPLLEVQASTYFDTLPISELTPPTERGGVEFHESDPVFPRSGHPDDVPLEPLPSNLPVLSDYLTAQLGQMRLVDSRLFSLCTYLIGCLDRRGYLDCPLEELATESGVCVRELEQALYAIQMLDPPGVGARNLSECLVLQLSQGNSFNRLTLAIVQHGLDALAKRNYSALARMLGVSLREAKAAAQEVLSLNPIPAHGFPEGGDIAYLVPDAVLRVENKTLRIELNTRVLPSVSIQEDYISLVGRSDDAEAKRYVHEKLAEANTFIKSIHARNDTLYQLLSYLAQVQYGFFCGGELRPVTMLQAADALGLSVSTVSRTVRSKYIQFNGRTFPLREFFSTALSPGTEQAVSSYAVRQRIRHLIQNEDAGAPLSDELICRKLVSDGISISRRAVAAHRSALKLPSASRRKKSEAALYPPHSSESRKKRTRI